MTVVVGFDLGWSEVAELAVEALFIEPADPSAVAISIADSAEPPTQLLQVSKLPKAPPHENVGLLTKRPVVEL